MANKEVDSRHIVAGAGIVAVLILVSVLGYYLIQEMMSGKPKANIAQEVVEQSDPEASNKYGAWYASKEIIRPRLKSPRTAKFAGYSSSSVQYTGIDADTGYPTYLVVSYVDSQNSFGALIRTKYAAVVAKTSTQWIIIAVESE